MLVLTTAKVEDYHATKQLPVASARLP